MRRILLAILALALLPFAAAAQQVSIPNLPHSSVLLDFDLFPYEATSQPLGQRTRNIYAKDMAAYFAAKAVSNSEQGSTLLAVVVANNSSVLSDTTHFTSAYDDYMLVIDNLVPANNQVEPQLQIHSGGVFQSTGYVNGAGGATTYVSLSSGNATIYNGAGMGYSTVLWLKNVNSAAVNKFVEIPRGVWFTGSAAASSAAPFGSWTSGQGAIDGFQIMMSSGPIATGSIKIYGLRNAL